MTSTESIKKRSFRIVDREALLFEFKTSEVTVENLTYQGLLVHEGSILSITFTSPALKVTVVDLATVVVLLLFDLAFFD